MLFYLLVNSDFFIVWDRSGGHLHLGWALKKEARIFKQQNFACTKEETFYCSVHLRLQFMK